jgi:hypothetical protein
MTSSHHTPLTAHHRSPPLDPRIVNLARLQRCLCDDISLPPLCDTNHSDTPYHTWDDYSRGTNEDWFYSDED